jgi:hypothetical protein
MQGFTGYCDINRLSGRNIVTVKGSKRVLGRFDDNFAHPSVLPMNMVSGDTMTGLRRTTPDGTVTRVPSRKGSLVMYLQMIGL